MYGKLGLMIRIPHRSRPPVVDGLLDDSAWVGAAVVDRFVKSLHTMRVTPAPGDIVVRFVYSNSALYVGLERHEDVSGLRAEKKTRDSWVWDDDAFGFGFFTSLTTQEHYSFHFNSIGVYSDGRFGGPGAERHAWNGEHTNAVHLGEDYWSVEVELPFETIELSGVQSGDIWLLNTTWGRTIDSVAGHWVSGHGYGAAGAMGLAVFE